MFEQATIYTYFVIIVLRRIRQKIYLSNAAVGHFAKCVDSTKNRQRKISRDLGESAAKSSYALFSSHKIVVQLRAPLLAHEVVVSTKTASSIMCEEIYAEILI